MSDLPDDLWTKILVLGINNNKLTYKDLCSISITCKRLHRLSSEDSLWSPLLSNDFPLWIYFGCHDPYRLFSDSLEEIANQPSSSSAKSQYRIWLERDREIEREEEAWRRAILEMERRWRELSEALERPVRFRMAVLEEENDLSDILSAKIQEIELAKEKKTRKSTVADLFNSTKANSKGFERVPEKRYPRERRSKAFTQRTKSWHR